VAIEVAYVVEATDPYCLTPVEIDRLLAGAPWRRLVVLGDSVAAGTSESVPGYRELSTSERIAEALRIQQPSLTYRNLGERELLTAEIRERQLDAALELDPDLAIVAAGGNDALRRSFDPVRFIADLRALLTPLAAHGAQLVTIGLFDLARSGLVPAAHAEAAAARFDELDEITASVAAELGALHVDNHHHPAAADPSIFASDRIHANARGHAIAASNLVRALAPRRVAVAPVP
jgi:lysophospholipase L1-like esterase